MATRTKFVTSDLPFE